jgi:hypothetical protein
MDNNRTVAEIEAEHKVAMLQMQQQLLYVQSQLVALHLATAQDQLAAMKPKDK